MGLSIEEMADSSLAHEASKMSLENLIISDKRKLLNTRPMSKELRMKTEEDPTDLSWNSLHINKNYSKLKYIKLLKSINALGRSIL